MKKQFNHRFFSRFLSVLLTALLCTQGLAAYAEEQSSGTGTQTTEVSNESTGTQSNTSSSDDAAQTSSQTTEGSNESTETQSNTSSSDDTAQTSSQTTETGDFDFNKDGTVDDFESKIKECAKNKTIPVCQRQVRKAMMPQQGQQQNQQQGQQEQQMQGNGQMMQQNGMRKPQKPMMKPEEMLKQMNEGDVFSSDFMKDFDPSSFRDFSDDQLKEVKPDFINGFAKNPEELKRMNPRIFNAENIDQIDPTVFNNMQQFGKSINPKIFDNVKDKEFFKKFNPDFLNSTDVSQISDTVLENIDPTQFSEMDPALYERMQKVAPEKLKMVPKKVMRATQMMLDDIPEDILKEYGFEGESAQKVKKMMQAVNKQKRDQVMQAFDGMNAEVQNGMMNMQGEFTNEIGDFMDYLPNVPKNAQEQFTKNKNGVLEKVKNMKEKLANLQATLGAAVTDEATGLTDELTSYNFIGTAADDLQKAIDTFVANVPNLTKEQAKEQLKLLKEEALKLREIAKQDKFTQGIIPFKDTDDNQWFTSFVSAAAKDGVIGGYKDAQGKSLGEFRPANKVTIAEAVKMAVASAGLKESTDAPTLELAKTHWAKGWVKAAEDKGLSVDSVTDLNAQATRGSVVRWAIEAYGIVPPKAVSSSFSDVALTDTNVDYIEYAKSLGIISGDGDTGKFRPNDTIIRAEVAKILSATAEKLATSSTATTN